MTGREFVDVAGACALVAYATWIAHRVRLHDRAVVAHDADLKRVRKTSHDINEELHKHGLQLEVHGTMLKAILKHFRILVPGLRLEETPPEQSLTP